MNVHWTFLLADMYIHFICALFSDRPSFLVIVSLVLYLPIPTEMVHIPWPSRVRWEGWSRRSKSAWHWSLWQSLFYSLLWRKSFCTLFNETTWLCLPPWPHRHMKHQRSLWECLFGFNFKLLHTAWALDVYPEKKNSSVFVVQQPFSAHVDPLFSHPHTHGGVLLFESGYFWNINELS